MRNVQTTHDDFQIGPLSFGFGGSVITPEEFVADDSLEPCTNNGQGKRLMYVTCIGGHVVSLYFDLFTSPVISAFPASISHLTELRHIMGSGRNSAELVFPCEFGSLANLVALVWGGIFSSNSAPLVFPADDQCMDGLVSLEEVMLGDYVVNRLPASIFSLPNIKKVSVRQAPLAALPPTMPPKLRVLKLSATGVSGPLPSFRNSPLLEEVALDNNRLTLGDASAFDYCPELKFVKLSYNNISSDLFTFNGTTKLETFEASQNMIRGGIPSQWELLTSCEKVVLSHNLVEASLKPLVKMTKLKYVDLVSRV
jgi:Leucine-rich repeat (LRR) protein